MGGEVVGSSGIGEISAEIMTGVSESVARVEMLAMSSTAVVSAVIVTICHEDVGVMLRIRG